MSEFFAIQRTNLAFFVCSSCFWTNPPLVHRSTSCVHLWTMTERRSGWLKYSCAIESEAGFEKTAVVRHWFILREDGIVVHSAKRSQVRISNDSRLHELLVEKLYMVVLRKYCGSSQSEPFFRHSREPFSVGFSACFRFAFLSCSSFFHSHISQINSCYFLITTA